MTEVVVVSLRLVRSSNIRKRTFRVGTCCSEQFSPYCVRACVLFLSSRKSETRDRPDLRYRAVTIREGKGSSNKVKILNMISNMILENVLRSIKR